MPQINKCWCQMQFFLRIFWFRHIPSDSILYFTQVCLRQLKSCRVWAWLKSAHCMIFIICRFDQTKIETVSRGILFGHAAALCADWLDVCNMLISMCIADMHLKVQLVVYHIYVAVSRNTTCHMCPISSYHNLQIIFKYFFL